MPRSINCVSLNGFDDVVIGVLGGDELSLVGANVSQTVTSVSEAFEEAESLLCFSLRKAIAS